MLIAREFDMTRAVANSDGKPVTSLGTESYVALYDNRVVSDAALREFVDEFEELELGVGGGNENIVVLPVGVWKRLRNMITSNYTMTEKK